MSSVWADKTIRSKAELLVLLALGDYCDDEGKCYPSTDTIAFKARCTQRAVQKIIGKLTKAGKVEVELNAGPRGTNVYRVIIGGVNAVHPEQSGPKKDHSGSPDPSGTVRKHQGKEKDPAIAEPGEHKLFVETWCNEYPDFFGVDYSFQGGKDGKAVKRLLKVAPVLELIRVAKLAWRHQGTYPFKCATGIAMFYSHINEIRAAAQKLAPAPVATTEDSWGPEALKRVINGQQRT